MKKDNLSVVEKHSYKIISEIEEVYPETGMKLIRPKLNIKKVIGFILVVLIFDIVISVLFSKLIFTVEKAQVIFTETALFFLFFFLFLSIVILIFRKSIFIFIIRVYQKYAPYQIRSTCLYVPNCSEYMILAIQKYGLIKGIKKGIKRYKRCEPPYGGIDYP